MTQLTTCRSGKSRSRTGDCPEEDEREMSDGAAETPDFELCRAMQSYLDDHDAISYVADLSEDL